MATSTIPTLHDTDPTSGPAPIAPFRNEAFLDFTLADVKRGMQEALRYVESQLGHEYPLIIGGNRVHAPGKIRSTNPARPAQLVGVHPEAEVEHVEQAVQAAAKAFESWKAVPVGERAALLTRTAELLRERKLEFCAWLTFEVGKNYAEADADVAECIDFLEFYAREALRLDRAETPIQFPGERNQLRYLPLGVGAVIAPWNFPLAILCGMTVAAVVTGNTVVMKPSIDAPTIAVRLLMLLEEAGMPEGVVNLLQGSGELAGRTLVEHPQVRFISFTGSKKVGLDVHERAAKQRPGQKFLKRTVLELGGKDAIIVDNDCDIDAAVEGVVASAFGFNGQKCSACSRAIVDTHIYDVFLDKLTERVSQIRQGDPADNFAMGPVISETSYRRVLDYIAIGRGEGRVLTGGGPAESETNGWYVQPTVIADVAPDARIAQEEIFGPVLAVIRSSSFPEAIEIVNNTDYGLTGAIYSNNRERLEVATEQFHVGNLYLNRKCTGAMVGAHPFGGFNLSGTDSKAGGPDYLLLFTQAKSIAEKLGVLPDQDEFRHPDGI
ncbi:L-glutamate gamma-semialdehyde dehydrogenase [Terriglobus aquaticus]|uniref:L-glutamate gamma-semialdehyde dehydrogenase n=1 Tax=Terriglobus aquaticus TaxID=940139 RepID=A0ABW9KJE4_9BACT|nr:L-glutamate gamma-semialdehyde dehydrogenase [Terriglobus aquaticus]